MKIIIEGPDCSGKSTLACALVREFGLTDDAIKHHHQRHTPADHMHWLVNNEHQPIADRLFWSEQIYGRIIRNRLQSDNHLLDRMVQQKRSLISRVDDLGIFTIMCIPLTFADLTKNYVEGEHYPKQSDLRDIYDLYKQLWYGPNARGISKKAIENANTFDDCLKSALNYPLFKRPQSYLYVIGMHEPQDFARYFYQYIRGGWYVSE